MKLPWSGFSIDGEPPLLGDDHLDGQCPSHRLCPRCGDRLVEGVGVQAVGIVVDGAQCLEGGADVVEGHLLGVQGSPRGLDVVLELLGPLVGAVAFLHGDGPDAAGHPTDDRVLGVHAVGEEEREIRCERVHIHPPGQVRLDVGESVGQGEGQLGDGVGAGFGNVVARDRDRVEVAHLVFDEPLLHVGHDAERELGREDTGVLPLILLQDVRLHGATHGPEHVGRHGVGLGRGGGTPLF